MSGDDARVAYPLFQAEDGGSIPTSPLQFEIVEISTLRAQKLNSLWHSRLPIFKTGFLLTAKVCYGAIHGGIFYAVAIWGHPNARLLPQKTWLELRRMAIAPEAPKNTASRMLKIMKILIKKKFPYVTTLISYQDTEIHQGTIYKAAGWEQANFHKGGSWYRPNSVNLSNQRPRGRPDLNKAIGAKIRWQKEIRGYMRVYKITPGEGNNPYVESNLKVVREQLFDWLKDAELGKKAITVDVLEMSEEEYNKLPEYMGP